MGIERPIERAVGGTEGGGLTRWRWAHSLTTRFSLLVPQVVYLKKRLADPKLDKSKIREYLLRLLYVELLGHDASFGHIHAVKLCSDASLVNKKVAYLTTCLFLSEESELLILLMNTMKSDLHSDNYLIVCASLDTVCHLATEDAVPLISSHALSPDPSQHVLNFLQRLSARPYINKCFPVPFSP